MNTWSHDENSDRTLISDKSIHRPSGRSARSALMNENLRETTFSVFFADTWSSHENDKIKRYLEVENIRRTPLLSDPTIVHMVSFHSDFPSDVERQRHGAFAEENKKRIILLARKYVEESNALAETAKENDARLAIATERVRELIPSVAKAELDELSNALTRVEEIAKSTSEIRNRLGFTPHRRG